jgi:hypothetical protein
MQTQVHWSVPILRVQAFRTVPAGKEMEPPTLVVLSDYSTVLVEPKTPRLKNASRAPCVVLDIQLCIHLVPVDDATGNTTTRTSHIYS